MKLYLNTSALNRPFDDQSIPRVRLEAEAVLSLVSAMESHNAELLSSEYLEFEVQQIPDPDRRQRVQTILRLARAVTETSSAIILRAHTIEHWGFRGLDALHIASAETAQADLLVTTDDRMLRRARRAGGEIRVRVVTPMEALGKVSSGSKP